MISFSRFSGATIAGIALSVFSGACGGAGVPAGELTGCRQEIRGVTGIIRPETSKLGCAAINDLVSSIPAEPENYLIRSDSPRLFWKCRYYGTEQGSVILRCEHDKSHFSLVKSAE